MSQKNNQITQNLSHISASSNKPSEHVSEINKIKFFEYIKCSERLNKFKEKVSSAKDKMSDKMAETREKVGAAVSNTKEKLF